MNARAGAELEHGWPDQNSSEMTLCTTCVAPRNAGRFKRELAYPRIELHAPVVIVDQAARAA